MNQFYVYILLICLCNLSSAYYIRDRISTPPEAKYGFNPLFVQQDEIGIIKFIAE